MTEDLQRQVGQLGKGLIQVHAKLGRILEAVEARGGGEGGPAVPVAVVFDVLDALEAALAALPAEGRSRGWWRRGRGAGGGEVRRGLALARDAALDALARQGIEPVAREGPFDAEVHRAVERLDPPIAAQEGRLAGTHRGGWVQRSAEGRRVLRSAQVSVYAREP